MTYRCIKPNTAGQGTAYFISSPAPHQFQWFMLLQICLALFAGGFAKVHGLEPLADNFAPEPDTTFPAAGSWTFTGSVNSARAIHTATLLPNGLVLVAGGTNTRSVESRSAELYDPATGTWTLTGSLNEGRFYYPATLLPNGKVLVEGGDSLAGERASAALCTPRAISTQQRCCPTAWLLWRVDTTPVSLFLGARNCSPSGPRRRLSDNGFIRFVITLDDSSTSLT